MSSIIIELYITILNSMALFFKGDIVKSGKDNIILINIRYKI